MYSSINSNKQKSLLLLAVFVGFACGIAYLAGLYLGGESFVPYAVGAALVYVVISYLASSKLALSMNGAQQVTRRQQPRLHKIVENLAISEGLPTPKIYVIDDLAPNAFATGRNPSTAVVGVTTGLLDMLNDKELQGVMAHELGHVKNYDVRVSMVAFALVSIVGIISDLILRMWFWGGLNDDDDAPAGNPVFMAIGFVAIILSPLIAMLIQLAISRRREFLADATGALTTRYPEGLASALAKIGQTGSAMRRQNTTTAHLFFANPLKGGGLSNLFSTHPPISERVERLRKMGGGL